MLLLTLIPEKAFNFFKEIKVTNSSELFMENKVPTLLLKEIKVTNSNLFFMELFMEIKVTNSLELFMENKASTLS